MKDKILALLIVFLSGCAQIDIREFEDMMTNAEKMRFLFEPIYLEPGADYIYYEEWECTSEMISCEFIQ